MRHAEITRARAWRAPDRRGGAEPMGALLALTFNVCLMLLAVAGAGSFSIIAREGLYAYEYSDAGAAAIRRRVERLNGGLIQLDFDRFRQWDDLVAMELMSQDVEAARGFLLSARGMLPDRYVNQINRRLPSSPSDAQIELATLPLLTPGTRSRYETTVPLLSRRAASATASIRAAGAPAPADARDFELIARALIDDPSTASLQFVLTGIRLGLAGSVTPRIERGAAALLDASRSGDYPTELGNEAAELIGSAVPVDAFRSAALANAQPQDAGAYENAAAAFHAAANPERIERARVVIDEIGAMSEATSHDTAVALIAHAARLRDVPKLRLIAQAAGARAAAAAKRLQRDGRLVEAARGELTMTRDLIAAIAVALAALAGLVGIVSFRAYSVGRRFWLRLRGDEEYGGELVDINRNWTPL